MLDLNWLSQEAKSIHDIFYGMFYALATVLLLIGVVTDYFKLPLGDMPGTPQLVGRVLIAAILLHSYPEVTNALSDFTDALAQRIGSFNEFHLVLSKMGDKLGELTWSWTSIKDSIILVFSFLTFFLLYISVYIANAGVVYVWVILYIFSPVLIALFILPVTGFATKVLYRTLIEVCAWKVVWAVLAALLWSSALGQMNGPESKVNFLTVIAYNLILAISLLLTPLVVNALASKGLAQASSSWLGLAAGAAAMSPGVVAKGAAKSTVGAVGSHAASAFSNFRNRYFEKKKAAPTRKSTSRPPSPPAWHKRVPIQNEPPEWMRTQLETEKHERKG